jgi:uncharacterized protein YgiM (DUF1202 family)
MLLVSILVFESNFPSKNAFVLCFSLKSKNKWLSSKSKKDYSMGKRKATIGQTMIYKNKLQRKLVSILVFESNFPSKNAF